MIQRKVLTALNPLRAFGLGTILLAAPMILEIVYEETILTWQSGPQMLGFTVAHVFPVLLLAGFLGGVGLHIFLLLWLGALAKSLIRRQTPRYAGRWIALAASLLLAMIYIPYQGWIIFSVTSAGAGPHGEALLQFAVADHHWQLAKSLLQQRVPVDGESNQRSPLNTSCERNDIDAARFLISHGAEITKAPECWSVTQLMSNGEFATQHPLPIASNTPAAPPAEKYSPVAEPLTHTVSQVKAKSHIPLLLPSRLPVAFAKTTSAGVELASEDGYSIQMNYKPSGGFASFAGSFLADAHAAYKPKEIPNVEPVLLDRDVVGYFRSVSCGGSCAPANLWWEINGTVYQIQLKFPPDLSESEQKREIKDVANSAIAAGPR